MTPTTRAAIQEPTQRLVTRPVWLVISFSDEPGSQPRCTSAEQPLRATTTTASRPAMTSAGRRLRRGVSGCNGGTSHSRPGDAPAVRDTSFGTFVLDWCSLAPRAARFVLGRPVDDAVSARDSSRPDLVRAPRTRSESLSAGIVSRLVIGLSGLPCLREHAWRA